jgi:hypothetical protein
MDEVACCLLTLGEETFSSPTRQLGDPGRVVSWCFFFFSMLTPRGQDD